MAQVLMKPTLRSIYNSAAFRFFLPFYHRNCFRIDNLPLQVEEIELADTEQCQQNTHFIRNLLDYIINNALGNLEKWSDANKITMSDTNEMPTIVQQFTSQILHQRKSTYFHFYL